MGSVDDDLPLLAAEPLSEGCHWPLPVNPKHGQVAGKDFCFLVSGSCLVSRYTGFRCRFKRRKAVRDLNPVTSWHPSQGYGLVWVSLLQELCTV